VENYFNYFTEIEEHFRKCRGTPALLSTLDWALIESWKEAGLPLEAVLIGIDRAFQKYAKRPRAFRKINGLAYCSQTVLEAAEEFRAAVREGGGCSASKAVSQPPFTKEEVQAYLTRNAEVVAKASVLARENGQQVLDQELKEAVQVLREVALREDAQNDLEELERQLTALEEKITASLLRTSSVELLAQFSREVQRALVPYRQKMTGPQIESLERQFTKKGLMEHYQIPRLSLFYL